MHQDDASNGTTIVIDDKSKRWLLAALRVIAQEHRPAVKPIAVGVKEAARLGFGTDSRTPVYEAHQRDLPFRKNGNKTLILWADLENYILNLPLAKLLHGPNADT